MEVTPSREWPGAEDPNGALMATVVFGSDEGMLESMFYDALERSDVEYMIDDNNYIVRGDWNDVRVRNFALGKDMRPTKPKPLISSAVTIKKNDYL